MTGGGGGKARSPQRELLRKQEPRTAGAGAVSGFLLSQELTGGASSPLERPTPGHPLASADGYAGREGKRTEPAGAAWASQDCRLGVTGLPWQHPCEWREGLPSTSRSALRGVRGADRARARACPVRWNQRPLEPALVSFAALRATAKSEPGFPSPRIPAQGCFIERSLAPRGTGRMDEAARRDAYTLCPRRCSQPGLALTT
jgi:hypothetical protein